jgi:methionyl-tRNA formyltransferase
VDRLVRAFAPWPSAFTHFRGRRLQILEGKPLPEKGEASVPGQVVALSKAGLDIGCGGGTVFRIERLQPENRREMSAHAYSLGVRICKGDVLS